MTCRRCPTQDYRQGMLESAGMSISTPCAAALLVQQGTRLRSRVQAVLPRGATVPQSWTGANNTWKALISVPLSRII